MSDDGQAGVDIGFADAGRPPREPVLDQGAIDAIAGYRAPEPQEAAGGVRAMLHTGALPRDRMPMFDIAFGDMAARLSGSLRKLLGSGAEVGFDGLAPRRWSEFVDDIVLPAHLAIFEAEGWDGGGVIALGPDFARIVLDALLGASRGLPPGGVGSRAFSSIETAILSRLADAALAAAEEALGAVAPVRLRRAAIETDPRLVKVARGGEVVAVASLSLRVDGRRGRFSVVVPYSTIEPVRPLLGQSFMGVKLGRDDHWAGHLATEIWQAELETEAVLHETALPLRRVLALAVGDTLMFDMAPTDLVEVRCGGLPLTRGRMGRVEGRIAVQVTEPLRASTGLGGEGMRA